MATTQNEFKVLEVPLQGTNLVEASAGTGKTYSIAILALRLILETNVGLSEILMVTYTKAAVAELEQRIRLFISNAAAVADGEVIKDKTITDYVTKQITKQGKDSVAAKLTAARLFIDETSILTIHSFCQLVLQEFSFETGALFGVNLVTSIRDIVKQEVQIFWRKYISGLPIEIFDHIEDVTVDNLTGIVQMQLSGKKYAAFELGKTYKLDEKLITNVNEETEKLEKQEDLLIKKQLAILQQTSEIKERIESNRYAKQHLLKFIDDSEALRSAIVAKPISGYKKEVFPDMVLLEEERNKVEDLKTSIARRIPQTLTCMALEHIIPAVQQAKEKLNVLGFDDLISELHNALYQRDNDILIKKLQAKYKAVFLDEFQDTDLKQYQIFKTAFARESIMFYIGDPKQSIYKFRSADVFTYLQARNEVENIYTMNTNYRSTQSYIHAANSFLKPTEYFDTFHFKNDANGITYVNVEAPDEDYRQLLKEDNPLPAIVIGSISNNDESFEAIASCVAMLLNGKHFLQTLTEKRLVIPSDIGILVKTNPFAKELSEVLSQRNIPSVLVSDAKIFGSSELQFIFNVLYAMLEPSVKTINKALLHPLTGLNESNVVQLNHENLLPIFNILADRWALDGVYSAIKDFFVEFEVESKLLAAQSTPADRSITNLQQATEILYKVERNNNLKPKDLLLWLQRMVEEDAEGDEYLQRIESEEDAVKISTVHKSKGLEYNIVIAPNLDYNIRKKPGFVEYRDATTGVYVSKRFEWMSDAEKEAYFDESEQEYRRLLYVAITRAVYASFILQSYSGGKNKNSTLSYFVNAIADKEIAKVDGTYFKNDLKFIPETETKKFVPNPVSITLSDSNWYKLSYSSVAAEVAALPIKRKQLTATVYDNFIFKTLTLGAETGNLVHNLFEKISFTSDEFWEESIAKVVTQYRPKDLEFLTQYKELASQVLGATIHTDDEKWHLSAVNSREKIHELEFYFPLANLDTALITDLFATHGITTYLKNIHAATGMMQGFVDLFFLHNGKYYILDWKTTFLGDAVQDYNVNAVANAMTEHNYHLQYMIYCVAVCKYLKSRKADFDYDKDFGGVIYGFVRGMRIGEESGIFFTKPQKEFVGKLDEILVH